ncbi:cytochrome C [Methylocystis sp. L43]|uniref:c-type cytochrome n=1 Tax=unclassified Methylocystis TaxID=2625913 RepID=UPI0018C34110|nr:MULTISPECIES: cytochrome C [unclassified Methylocystis]MBG0798112.1 cytochrome C [Methylocystis sp. L43]MBG0805510.1 cytochrome C [Methylocystis sp. H15]
MAVVMRLTSAIARVSFVACLALASHACLHASAFAQTAPAGEWRAEQEKRLKALDAYISRKPVAYRWFADFPFGLTDGAPFIILKLLPKLAPEEWGSGNNFLDVAGLFIDERDPTYPIARGFGWTGLARNDPSVALDYAALSCGACHIGRVRLDDGSFRYLDGGVNTQFNLVQYRVRVRNTIEKITAGATTPEEKIERATRAILTALDKAHAQDRNYFYKNYSFAGRRFDAAYETRQIELFMRDAPAIVEKFLTRAGLEYVSLLDLVYKNYKGFEEQMTQGFGGMADATGVSTSMVYAAAEARGETPDPKTSLPPTPGITDFMAVWEQEKRLARWSPDHTQLVDGGGQWNGNIPIPIFRNLAAELTLGLGADTDIRIAAFSEDLLRDLPAPVYPFPVDLALAKKGAALFEENCAACHRPHNGKIYDLGVDLGRARVVSDMIAKNARDSFAKICPPTRVVEMPPSGDRIAPCAKFEGVSLENRADVSMADPATHEGYNALPLGGVWAQAPYLHNGSVPTLYHLLVPRERPAVFIKSRLDYDKKLVGFSWEPAQTLSREGYRFDTTSFPALSNKGHDKDVIEDGKTLKLDWSDDVAGAMAIVEYLKTK